jgi:hypothetical protein
MRFGGIIALCALLLLGGYAMRGAVGNLTTGADQIQEAMKGVGEALRPNDDKPYKRPTWAEKYDRLSCRHFTKKLSRREKAIAAKQLLTILRVRDRGPLGAQVTPPTRSLTLSFRAAMSEECSSPLGWSMGQAAQQAYLHNPQFRP